MFDAIFGSLMAWNSIMMLLGGLIFLGLGTIFIWDFISVRLVRRRVQGRVVAVRVTGVKESTPGNAAEPLVEKSKPKESLGKFFRRDPKGAIIGSFFALLIICVPLSFLVFGAYQAHDVLMLRNTGVSAPAVVIRIESRSDSEGGTTYAPVLSFTDQHRKRWELADRLSSSRQKYKRGDEIAVYYDPDNPKSFIMKDFWRYMLFNLIFMAIPFLLCALLAYASHHKKKRPANRKRKNTPGKGIALSSNSEMCKASLCRRRGIRKAIGSPIKSLVPWSSFWSRIKTLIQ